MTHLALLAANYLQGVLRKKTAVLEWNDHGDFSRFGNMCSGHLRDKHCYCIQNVDYYPRADGSRLKECLESGYQEILIDFGLLDEQVCVELTRCSAVWIIMSFSEWQMDGFEEIVKSGGVTKGTGWLFLTVFGSEESRIEWNKRRQPKILRIPFSADAFTVTNEVIEWSNAVFMQSSFSGNVSRQNLRKRKRN